MAASYGVKLIVEKYSNSLNISVAITDAVTCTAKQLQGSCLLTKARHT